MESVDGGYWRLTPALARAQGSSTAYWVDEDGSLTISTPTFTDVNLMPKTVGAYTSWTRRTILNASPDLEQLLRRDLAATLANAVDDAAILSDGSGNKLTGIISQSGVGSVDMSTPTWGGVLEFIRLPRGDRVLRPGPLQVQRYD